MLPRPSKLSRVGRRAVETALGDYLEAVCVDDLDSLAQALESFSKGRIALMQTSSDAHDRVDSSGEAGPRLAAKVKGPAAVTGQLSSVLTAESLAEALQMRPSLAAGQSVITRGGEWVGRAWLRVSRGADHHAGVIEREHRLKTPPRHRLVVEERVNEGRGLAG